MADESASMVSSPAACSAILVKVCLRSFTQALGMRMPAHTHTHTHTHTPKTLIYARLACHTELLDNNGLVSNTNFATSSQYSLTN